MNWSTSTLALTLLAFGVVSTILGIFVLWRQPLLEVKDKWDLGLKIIGFAPLLFAGVVGLWQLGITAGREAQKPFWEKQLQTCFEASTAAATIATSTDKDAVSKAVNDFWRLYWGPLAIVEAPEVERAMVTFGACQKDKAQCSLEKLSLELAHRCREQTAASWQVQLGPLPRRERGAGSADR